MSLYCPLPIEEVERVSLAAGGGGRAMRRLLERVVAPRLPGAVDHDGAVLPPPGGRLAFTTDASVVSPRAFPGGDLGQLAVFGAVNDLAMCGAQPLALSLSLILEEGLPLSELERVLDGVALAAARVGVPVVTGDTKVVERGKADGLFATVSGVGVVPPGVEVHPRRIAPGDAILLSGDVGRHGVALIGVRENLSFDVPIESDCAPVNEVVAALIAGGIDLHALRDPTRGGLAAALVELASATLRIDEAAIPLDPGVAAVCELLGLDPLHLPCEGRFVAFVAEEQAEEALKILRGHPLAAGAARIGRVEAGPPRVRLRGPLGAERLLEMPEGELLPRIC